ncbi:MAG: F0F1 ATP synthase subunit alpha [Chloroflexi bacterium HGW-Chloroflexi-10]|nr:MAG: F0F1 ATP synthase subunit alpha [Chloroflexi bacterium HGW-Chloroflexi-10]
MSDSIKTFKNDFIDRINQFEPVYQVQSVGTVTEAGDGIAQVDGLADIRSQELVQFENGVMGVAFNLESSSVGVIILGEYSSVSEGMRVYSTGRIASVPVGNGLIGRVVNALGEPIDGKGPIAFDKYRPIERLAPGVIERQDVDTPVQTGIITIDASIPIGRGQRELIIGDRQTGKTAIAIDAIINQKGKDLICIYVAIGQKKSAVARIISILERTGAMDHTIVVLAAADESAALQYIAPYSGCTMGEEFMETGRDALIVYDDLSKHAWAYRQVSLLLRRPPGREAYPGDLFYLHSRLLERASRLAFEYMIVRKELSETEATVADAMDNKIFKGPQSRELAENALKNKYDPDQYKVVQVRGTGGSLTALPIIETLLGDVSAYVPTNVISITDGQIYLESNLFNAGIRPAVNAGISVSRVGGAAQTKAMRQVAGRLRLDMASFRDLAAFAQFGADLDKATQDQLNRGLHLQEILKQPQYAPMSLADQVISLFAGVNGLSDRIATERMKEWQTGLLKFIDSTAPEIKSDIESQKRITEESDKKMREVIHLYNSTWN